LVIDPTRAIEVNRNLAERNGERMLIYYWYQSRGRAVASDYRNKLLLVRDALTRHRSDGALIRVAAPAEPDVVQAREAASSFIRAVYPALTVSLPE
jgi:EpsI family protein